MKCPNCNAILDTIDWTENFSFNDEIFEIECDCCNDCFDVHVDITPKYTIVEEQ